MSAWADPGFTPGVRGAAPGAGGGGCPRGAGAGASAGDRGGHGSGGGVCTTSMIGLLAAVGAGLNLESATKDCWVAGSGCKF